MNVTPTDLPGVLIIEPRVFPDNRGFFFESWQQQRYGAAGLPPMVQDNHSGSSAGTVRGLHYQLLAPQAKLIRVLRGSVWDVAVDIRRGSPTFGRWVGVTLSAENRRQLFIPAGFAHGFCALEDENEVEYKCSDYYRGDDQRGVRFDDPTLAISWPVKDPVLSDKDRTYAHLSPDRDDLPAYEP